MADPDNGLYRPGDTLLHRVDPRLKVIACLLLVVLAFAATGWPQLAVAAALLASGSRLAAAGGGRLWRFCWMLRWLLLFTLLMHLLLSPGRTLWGTSWLSLDGLLLGALVCARIVVAVLASALLAMTTSSAELAGTFGWFARPLQWFGCRTRQWQGLVLLTMDFLPVVKAEFAAAAGRRGDHGPAAAAPSVGRWEKWTQQLQGLLWRLVERGDEVALQLAASDDLPSTLGELPALLPMALHDRLFAAGTVLAVVGYWLAG